MIPLTRDGLREILIATLLLGGGGAGCAAAAWLGSGWWAVPAAALLGLWVFVLAFFRDPPRRIPDGPGLLVSPADGKVTDVTTLESCDGIDGPALRIGIFLSVFNVHVNRAPCAGEVLRTQYSPGEFLDARHPDCGSRNESNAVWLRPGGNPSHSLVVRQIAGLIARRIVCRARKGDRLQRGERFGMIKFGSRTELIVPLSAGYQPAVQVGDCVKGGTTVLFKGQQSV